MKVPGKTIQIYCPSGEPRGVRIAEITTRIIQAVVVPRAKLDEGLRRPELAGVGLYVLFGDTSAMSLPLAYVGEAEDCCARLKQHNRNKDFWNTAVAIVSRTGSFTKAHGKLLEWLAVRKAIAAGRFQLENVNAGSEPVVPEWMQADVAEVFETAEVLLSTLGLPLFEPAAGHTSDSVFFCKRGGADARGVYNEDGFVVLTGSIARRETTSSAHDGLLAKREELVSSGVLTKVREGFRFERDMAFSSPSAAAALVTGGSANGWIEWRDSAGKTLDDVYRRSVNS